MQLVDDYQMPTSGQACIRYPGMGGVALAGGLIVDQTVDQITPVAGTIIKQ
jgi:hypothetical protein